MRRRYDRRRGVKLDIEDGRVTAAYVNSTLFRGFERILQNRKPEDALVFAPRICCICSLSRSLDPSQIYHAVTSIPTEGRGIGLTEAARGLLSHWIVVEKGRIANYQIIAPTTWNFPPATLWGRRSFGEGACRHAGPAGRKNTYCGAACRAFLRPLYGLHRSLISLAWVRRHW